MGSMGTTILVGLGLATAVAGFAGVAIAATLFGGHSWIILTPGVGTTGAGTLLAALAPRISKFVYNKFEDFKHRGYVEDLYTNSSEADKDWYEANSRHLSGQNFFSHSKVILSSKLG